MSDFSPTGFRFGYLVLGAGIFIVAAVVGLQLIEKKISGDDAVKRRQKEVRALVAIERARGRELASEVEAERLRHERIREIQEKQMEFRRLNGKVEEAGQELETRAMEKDHLQAEINRLAKSFRVYRATARARIWATAVGRRLLGSDLIKAQPYDHLVISKVDESGITARHSSGVVGIPVAEIAPALRSAFDLDLGGTSWWMESE